MCAKSKSFFGLRRGSTKSLTFQVLDGVQITKDRVTEVRNPRTEKQRIQRVLMNTALRAYSAMQGICNHSFEGVAYGGKTQQAFLAENIKAVRARLADQGSAYKYEKSFVPIGQTFVAPNAYVISKGSLPVMEYSLANGLVLAGASSYAEFLTTNKAQAGDQLTICLLVGDNRPRNTQFVYCRIILQPQNESGENITLASAFVADGKIANANLNNENTDMFGFENVGGSLVVTYNGQQIHAGAAILSRLVNNTWMRSSQSMVFKSPKIGFTLGEAVQQSTSDIQVNDPYYLNNAGDGNVTPVAAITSVMYNNVVLASGATIEPGYTLVITGTKLAGANIELYNGSQKYVHATSSDTEVTYSLSTIGNYTLTLNGQPYATFKIADPSAAPQITKVSWSGIPQSLGANVQAPFNSNIQLELEVAGGFDSNAVVSSDASLAISNKQLSGTKFTATVSVGKSGVIKYGDVVIVAVTGFNDSGDQEL